MHPKAQKSHGNECPSPEIISGAKYSGVPTKLFVNYSGESKILHRPKSDK